MVCLDYCESLYDECKTAGFNKTLIGQFIHGNDNCTFSVRTLAKEQAHHCPLQCLV